MIENKNMQNKQKQRDFFRQKDKNVNEENDDKYILNNYKIKRKILADSVQNNNQYEQTTTNNQQNLPKNYLLNNNKELTPQKLSKQSNFQDRKVLHNSNILLNFNQQIQSKKDTQSDGQKITQQANQNLSKFSQQTQRKAAPQRPPLNEINDKWNQYYGTFLTEDKENILNKQQQLKGFQKQKNNLFVKSKNKLFQDQKKPNFNKQNIQYQNSVKINQYYSPQNEKPKFSKNVSCEQQFQCLNISNSESEEIKIKQKTQNSQTKKKSPFTNASSEDLDFKNFSKNKSQNAESLPEAEKDKNKKFKFSAICDRQKEEKQDLMDISIDLSNQKTQYSQIKKKSRFSCDDDLDFQNFSLNSSKNKSQNTKTLLETEKDKKKKSKFSTISDHQKEEKQDLMDISIDLSYIKSINAQLMEEAQKNREKQILDQFEQVRSSLQQSELNQQNMLEEINQNILNSFQNTKDILNHYYTYQNIHKVQNGVFQKVFMLYLKKPSVEIIPLEIKTNSL